MKRRAVPLVAVILASLAIIGTLSVPASGATPDTGSISDTSPNTTWTGQFYVVGGTTLPEECPPPPPPAPTPHLGCDHFFLTNTFPTDPALWDTHTGPVTSPIQWPSSGNGFDLDVYGPAR